MKINELTHEQLNLIIPICPIWMAANRLIWMADNRPDWMANQVVPDNIMKIIE